MSQVIENGIAKVDGLFVSSKKDSVNPATVVDRAGFESHRVVDEEN